MRKPPSDERQQDRAPAIEPAEPEQPTPAPAPTPMRFPAWMRAVPFFMSAVMFMSGVFALFAPLPLLFSAFRWGRGVTFFGVVTNGVIVWFASGAVSFAFYCIFVATLTLTLPEYLRRFRKLEISAALTLGSMALVGISGLLLLAALHGVSPITELKGEVAALVNGLVDSLSPEARKQWMGQMEVEEWKQNLLIELPSAIAVFSLVLVWANLLVVLRINPEGLRERLGLAPDFARRWKAPEILLWPTIVAGFVLVFGKGLPADVALNVAKFFMAVYAIQGLSILAFLFDLWKVRGFLRTIGYLVGVFLMMPLLLSVGFFDQWFDFRSKFRQS